MNAQFIIVTVRQLFSPSLTFYLKPLRLIGFLWEIRWGISQGISAPNEKRNFLILRALIVAWCFARLRQNHWNGLVCVPVRLCCEQKKREKGCFVRTIDAKRGRGDTVKPIFGPSFASFHFLVLVLTLCDQQFRFTFFFSLNKLSNPIKGE